MRDIIILSWVTFVMIIIASFVGYSTEALRIIGPSIGYTIVLALLFISLLPFTYGYVTVFRLKSNKYRRLFLELPATFIVLWMLFCHTMIVMEKMTPTIYIASLPINGVACGILIAQIIAAAYTKTKIL